MQTSIVHHRSLGLSSASSRPAAGRRVAVVPCRCSLTTSARQLAGSRSHAFSGQRVSSTAPASRMRQPSSISRSRTSVAVQANLFSRLFRVIKAYVDSFVGSFEDPDKLLDRVVDEMTQDSMRMRQASAQAIAAQRQMDARAKNMQGAADQWLRRAELAVARGQDDLGREALLRRKAMQGDADRLKEQASMQKKAVDQLQGSVAMLENKIQEARGKKETLKARAASARSNIAVQELIGGLRSTSSSSFAAFDKMEEKVMALEAEAESVAAMAVPDALEARFSLLEHGNVEDELQALKQGTAASQAYLPRPAMRDVLQRTPDALDMELDELRRRARQ